MSRKKRHAPPPPDVKPRPLPPPLAPPLLTTQCAEEEGHVLLTQCTGEEGHVIEDERSSRNSSPTSHDSGIPSDSESNLTVTEEEKRGTDSIISDR